MKRKTVFISAFMLLMSSLSYIGCSVDDEIRVETDHQKANRIKENILKLSNDYGLKAEINEKKLLEKVNDIHEDSLGLMIKALSSIIGTYYSESVTRNGAEFTFEQESSMMSQVSGSSVTVYEWYNFSPQYIDKYKRYVLAQCRVSWYWDGCHTTSISVTPTITTYYGVYGTISYSTTSAYQYGDQNRVSFSGRAVISIYDGLVTYTYLVSGDCTPTSGSISWVSLI